MHTPPLYKSGYRRLIWPVVAALLFALLAVAWDIYAPYQFGGQSAYVIVNGNSMEPLYHKGDLVMLRTGQEYQVGDIVAYRHPQIGPVIHRIIAEKGKSYVVKGDHNPLPDLYYPVDAEIIGKAVQLFPGVGTTVVWLRQPLVMAFWVALIVLLLLWPQTKRGRKPAWMGEKAL